MVTTETNEQHQLMPANPLALRINCLPLVTIERPKSCTSEHGTGEPTQLLLRLLITARDATEIASWLRIWVP
jgi:hypothetical protein